MTATYKLFALFLFVLAIFGFYSLGSFQSYMPPASAKSIKGVSSKREDSSNFKSYLAVPNGSNEISKNS